MHVAALVSALSQHFDALAELIEKNHETILSLKWSFLLF